MRLLLVSDLHYSVPLFDWVAGVATDFDVVVMAGDHLDLASLVDGRAQTTVVRKYFDRIRAKTRLLICSGNHDLDSKNEAGEWMAPWLLGRRNDGGALGRRVDEDRRHSVYGMPSVGRPGLASRCRPAIGEGREGPERALDLDLSRAPVEIAHRLERSALFWGRCAARMDR